MSPLLLGGGGHHDFRGCECFILCVKDGWIEGTFWKAKWNAYHLQKTRSQKKSHKYNTFFTFCAYVIFSVNFQTLSKKSGGSLIIKSFFGILSIYSSFWINIPKISIQKNFYWSQWLSKHRPFFSYQYFSPKILILAIVGYSDDENMCP